MKVNDEMGMRTVYLVREEVDFGSFYSTVAAMKTCRKLRLIRKIGGGARAKIGGARARAHTHEYHICTYPRVYTYEHV